MLATDFPEYSREISDLLNGIVKAGHATLINLQIDQRSAVRGLINSHLLFQDDSELHLREFVDLTQVEPRVMYVYHFQDASGKLVFRYDNAVHRPPLPQLSHKHIADEVIAALAPTLMDVLDEILARHVAGD
ncbi:MAG: hypothetical protein FJ011_12500 [Chloroflexi bacterium]|nr:hypothetical protein [Chloroflexota bacterium]